MNGDMMAEGLSEVGVYIHTHAYTYSYLNLMNGDMMLEGLSESTIRVYVCMFEYTQGFCVWFRFSCMTTSQIDFGLLHAWTHMDCMTPYGDHNNYYNMFAL